MLFQFHRKGHKAEGWVYISVSLSARYIGVHEYIHVFICLYIRRIHSVATLLGPPVQLLVKAISQSANHRANHTKPGQHPIIHLFPSTYTKSDHSGSRLNMVLQASSSPVMLPSSSCRTPRCSWGLRSNGGASLRGGVQEAPDQMPQPPGSFGHHGAAALLRVPSRCLSSSP